MELAPVIGCRGRRSVARRRRRIRRRRRRRWWRLVARASRDARPARPAPRAPWQARTTPRPARPAPRAPRDPRPAPRAPAGAQPESGSLIQLRGRLAVAMTSRCRERITSSLVPSHSDAHSLAAFREGHKNRCHANRMHARGHARP
jgi:hypothetical protein